MSCYGYVSDMFRKAVKYSDTIEDIKGALNFFLNRVKI